jgi:uncharacterized Fe-S cluster protein YjdI
VADIDFAERDKDRVKREYRNDRIVVTWEPALCIHSGVCVRGLPDVFMPMARPWVKINAAEAEEIARIVDDCPSFALKYRLLEPS